MLDTAPDARPEALLRLDRIGVRYRVETREMTAVEDVTLEIADGERVMLLGPSGCGKSTLLKVIAGFQPPNAGAVTMHGRPVTRPGPDRFVVFQEFDQLFPWKTVLGNVADCIRLTRGTARAEATRKATAFLHMVGLGQHLPLYPHMLSGGMKQRVAIARAWSVDPEILLMDEPFAALDAQTRANLQDETMAIWERSRRTLIFVTHSIEEALYLGTRIVVMGKNPGRILRILDNPFAGTRDRPDAAELRREVRALLAEPAGAAA